MLKCLKQSLRHALVVFLCVADVCEDLSQRFFLVDAYELLVLSKLLLIYLIGVDVLCGVVFVGLVVNETLQWQAVTE